MCGVGRETKNVWETKGSELKYTGDDTPPPSSSLSFALTHVTTDNNFPSSSSSVNAVSIVCYCI